MSGVRSKRLLSSETEYFGYLENSEEQYGDYYNGNFFGLRNYTTPIFHDVVGIGN